VAGAANLLRSAAVIRAALLVAVATRSVASGFAGRAKRRAFWPALGKRGPPHAQRTQNGTSHRSAYHLEGTAP